jgi:hypothetical protein
VSSGLKVVLILGGFVFVLVAISVACTPVEREEHEEPEPEVVGVSSARLLSEFERNEVRAEQEYRDVRIEVLGEVTLIHASPFYVEVNGELRCFMRSDEEDAVAQLDRGDEVTLRGESPSLTVGNVYLRDCEVVR